MEYDNIIFEDNGNNTLKVTGISNKSITNIEIPSMVDGKKVTEIGERTFFKCTGLKSIKIPEGVTQIEDSTFEGCKNLTSVTLVNSVKGIGSSAFFCCNNLTDLYYSDTQKEWNNIEFSQ